MYIKPKFSQQKNNTNIFCFLNSSLCSTVAGNLYSLCCVIVIWDLTV